MSDTPQDDPVFQKLTGPGGAFEIVEEEVLGQRVPVFRERYRSLPELLVDSQKFADREFMVDGDRRITYGEHFQLVKALSAMLAQDYGIGKGDRVAIFAENCIEWDVSLWAVLSLGAIGVAMNGWWTEPEFMHAWELTEPKLLLADAKRLRRLNTDKLGTPLLMLDSDLDNLAAAPVPDFPVVSIAEDDPAVIMFTSGTTGKAKGALISHRTEIGFIQCALFSTAYTMAQWGLSLADRPAGTTLGTSPFFHISGLGGLMLLTRANGDKVVLYRGGFDPDRVLRIIDKEKVSTWTALGGMGPKILACPNLDQYDLSSVTALIFGGAPVSESVREGLRNVFTSANGTPAIGYGSTETGSIPVGFSGQEYIDHPQATGRINILHQLQIRDESGRVLDEGKEGLVWVRSAFTMLGYWRNDAATSEVMDADRWLCPGDIGHMDGGLLYLNSRARDLILRSAENIYPVEIENRLDAHPGVKESAVYGVDDAVHGQAVKAVVVLTAEGAVDESELAAWVGQGLAAFKVPEHWRLTTEALPRNASGKALKDALRALDQ